MPGRYRSHAAAPRTRQVRLRFTDTEHDQVSAAAHAAGLSTSGYAAEAAIAAASQLHAPSLAPWREVLGELIQARIQVRRIGVNLNQVARVLNADGDTPVWLERACQLAERALYRADAAADDVVSLARSGKFRDIE